MLLSSWLMSGTATVGAVETGASTRSLLLAYIGAMSDVALEPAISIKSFFISYGKLIAWELGFLQLFFVLPYSLFVFVWNHFSADKRAYSEGIFVRYSREAFHSLREGEIPLLKSLTLRYMTELFVAYHIRWRIDRVSFGLQNQEVLQLLSGDNLQNSSLKTDTEIVEKFRPNFTSRIRLEIGILLPLLAYLPAVIKFFDLDKNKDIFVRMYHWLFLPSVHSTQMLISFLFIFQSLIWIFASGFIRQREIMRQHNVYACEQHLFKELDVPPIREFPLDLVVWCLLLAFAYVPIWIRFLFSSAKLPESQRAGFSHLQTASLLIYLLPLLYALYRRLRIGNR